MRWGPQSTRDCLTVRVDRGQHSDPFIAIWRSFSTHSASCPTLT